MCLLWLINWECNSFKLCLFIYSGLWIGIWWKCSPSPLLLALLVISWWCSMTECGEDAIQPMASVENTSQFPHSPPPPFLTLCLRSLWWVPSAAESVWVVDRMWEFPIEWGNIAGRDCAELSTWKSFRDSTAFWGSFLNWDSIFLDVQGLQLKISILVVCHWLNIWKPSLLILREAL